MRFYPQRKFLFLVFIALCLSNELVAQIIIDEPPKPRYYQRTRRITKFKDWNDFRDVFHYDKFLLGRNRISGSVSYNTGRVLIDDGEKIRPVTRRAMGYFTRIRFLEQFSVNTTFYKDYNPEAASPWIADYTYSIGRYNWENKKLNFGYENYVQNQYTDNAELFWEHFLEGYYYVSYNWFLPDSLNKRISIDGSSSMRFVLFSRYSIHYKNKFDQIKGELLNGKPVLGLACRYTMFWNIYVEGAVYYYFDPEAYQAPWDPDFTYGFGYYNWKHFRLAITYGNWAINRFPWNEKTYPNYGFEDGSFRILVNWIW